MKQLFSIIGKSPLDAHGSVIAEVEGSERQAVETAEIMHSRLGLALTLVVDADLAIVYRIERKCGCREFQYDFISNTWTCVKCGVVVASVLEEEVSVV